MNPFLYKKDEKIAERWKWQEVFCVYEWCMAVLGNSYCCHRVNGSVRIFVRFIRFLLLFR